MISRGAAEGLSPLASSSEGARASGRKPVVGGRLDA